MTQDELYHAIASGENVADVEAAIDAFVTANANDIVWRPVGDRPNNRGTVEAAADPGRSIVERVTNGIDAVLEYEHDAHHGQPNCRSPREAASAWFGMPVGGLSEMTQRQRQNLARRMEVRLLPGESKSSRVIEVRDNGIGIAPDRMASTILSLNESNKIEKHYLAGAYGQGGSSTFASSKYTLVASRSEGHRVGFTIVKFEDLPPEQFKIGRYVYMTLGNAVLEADVPLDQFQRGSVVRHFGYDLSGYTSPVGPTSLYGLLNFALFDPVMPIWFDNRVHDYRRVIKGSRNALNGAVDEGDERARGPQLSHNVPLFYVSLGDFGRIGIEYWVLQPPDRENKKPNAGFANPVRPIIMTLNGQNQAELPVSLIRKDAELPYLTQRIVCHIDCNSLSRSALRTLFVSNREDARRGMVYELIRDELIRVLKSDDELKRLNTEAREHNMQDRDENASREMRREVARLLRLQGFNITEPSGGGGGRGTDPEPRQPRPPRPRPPVQPIPTNEPPTFISIKWDEDEEITFFPEQRRYIRIETDANSTYHDPNNPAASRINFIVTNGEVTFRGSTPLRGGRMRAIFDCAPGAGVDGTGTIRVELMRVGLPVLADERALRVVPVPPPLPGRGRVEVPPFEWQRIDGPDDPRWSGLGWPDDINAIAYDAEMEDGTLIISYSAAYPKYAGRREMFEGREIALAESFTKRYEIWLAIHALLMYNDQQAGSVLDADDAEALEQRDREERKRFATASVLVATREATSPTPDLAAYE